MRVQLVWTPYERVAYVLWHVALRCVIAGDCSGTAPHAGMRNSRGQGSALPTQAEVWCELPAATDSAPPQAHLDPSSVVLVPPTPPSDLGNSGPTTGTRDFAEDSVCLRAGFTSLTATGGGAAGGERWLATELEARRVHAWRPRLPALRTHDAELAVPPWHE